MSKAESTLAETNHDEGGEFIQVRKKSERTNNTDKTSTTSGSSNDKKKSKPRSRQNSIGEGKPNKARYVCFYHLEILIMTLVTVYQIQELISQPWANYQDGFQKWRKILEDQKPDSQDGKDCQEL